MNQTQIDKPQIAVEQWGEQTPAVDHFASPCVALEEVERLVGWLGYIADGEYSATESAKIIAACKRFADVAQPIASKHLD